MNKKTDGGHQIDEADLREMQEEEPREMPDGVEAQTGTCRFCGQAGIIHTITPWSQEKVDEEVTCKCDCDQAKKYAESKERVQKAKNRITELFGSSAEKPVDEAVVNIMLDVLVINEDGNVVSIHDEAWTFQFIPIMAGR